MMKKFKKTDGAQANGTSLQTYLTASFEKLIEVFGEPTYENSDAYDKVNLEWVLTNGENVVTIYNWKDYDGGQQAQANPEYHWHIGGRNKQSAFDLQDFFEHMTKCN